MDMFQQDPSLFSLEEVDPISVGAHGAGLDGEAGKRAQTYDEVRN